MLPPPHEHFDSAWINTLTSVQDIISEDAIQRRIETLEQQDNDYFKAGMHTAVMRAEANGFVLPPYDPDNYPSKYYVSSRLHKVLSCADLEAAASQDRPRDFWLRRTHDRKLRLWRDHCIGV